ncbi:hypothetical protein ACQJBY_047526 [Aegilops geniculata]
MQIQHKPGYQVHHPRSQQALFLRERTKNKKNALSSSCPISSRISSPVAGRRLPAAAVAAVSQIGKNKMVINGDAPARGSAAAAASLRRRRTTSGAVAAGGGGGGTSTMLQFYTDEAAGRKMSPNAVLIMSIGFVAVVAVLHVFGKLYR